MMLKHSKTALLVNLLAWSHTLIRCHSDVSCHTWLWKWLEAVPAGVITPWLCAAAFRCNGWGCKPCWCPNLAFLGCPAPNSCDLKLSCFGLCVQVSGQVIPTRVSYLDGFSKLMLVMKNVL